jgi:hypothetical protein
MTRMGVRVKPGVLVDAQSSLLLVGWGWRGGLLGGEVGVLGEPVGALGVVGVVLGVLGGDAGQQAGLGPEVGGQLGRGGGPGLGEGCGLREQVGDVAGASNPADNRRSTSDTSLPTVSTAPPSASGGPPGGSAKRRPRGPTSNQTPHIITLPSPTNNTATPMANPTPFTPDDADLPPHRHEE